MYIDVFLFSLFIACLMWLWKNRKRSFNVMTRRRGPQSSLDADTEASINKQSVGEASPKAERLYEFITAIARLALIMAYVFLCDR